MRQRYEEETKVEKESRRASNRVSAVQTRTLAAKRTPSVAESAASFKAKMKEGPNYICYLAQKLCFWRGIIFIRMYVSVCDSLYRLSQKVLDRF